jgi:hypothetical protein
MELNDEPVAINRNVDYILDITKICHEVYKKMRLVVRVDNFAHIFLEFY